MGLDTCTGVKLARKTHTYDYKLLREKTIKKALGYIIFLIALWIFTMMLFLINIKDGVPFIDSYYLNIPMMTTILFFAGIEFLSVRDNLAQTYGIKTPTSVTRKIETFIASGGEAPQSLDAAPKPEPHEHE
ncbi:phage holin family protein [Emticicia sp. 17c]|uniref:phage holin family protein n=1 Tax=Emticicia sp. 17c TaxID=3127704 RepID=UPI00301DB28C